MSLAGLLRPSKLKLVFTSPWLAYMVFAVFQSHFNVIPILWNLLWPLGAYYLIGGLLEATAISSRTLFGERQLWLSMACMVILDHSLKWMVNSNITLGESIPLVAQRLHLANIHNTHGSWLIATMDASPVVTQVFVYSVLSLVSGPLLFRFYSQRHRVSFWSLLTYAFFMAGNASAALDLGARGLVVDYLLLPGLFAMDLKDIYLTMFASCLFVEAMQNPKISLRWLGWHEEMREFPRLVREVVRFSGREIKDLFRRK